MASPTPKVGAGRAGHDSSVTANPSAPHRPIEALLNTQSTTDVLAAAQRDPNAGNKRRNHRGGKKKKKNRRQSFLPTAAEEEDVPARPAHDLQEPASATAPRPSFYRLGRRGSRNLSETRVLTVTRSSPHAATVRHYHSTGHFCNIQVIPQHFGYVLVLCYVIAIQTRLLS